MSSNKKCFEKAKDYAFLLLKFRLRSEKELYLRLKIKKYDEKIIKKVLSFLREKEYINDNVFARSWIESRIKKPFGLRRIKKELLSKGVSKDIINNQIKSFKEIFPEEEIISNLARQRLNKLRNIEPRKARLRLYAYLMRRGFSPDLVTEIINQLCRQEY